MHLPSQSVNQPADHNLHRDVAWRSWREREEKKAKRTNERDDWVFAFSFMWRIRCQQCQQNIRIWCTTHCMHFAGDKDELQLKSMNTHFLTFAVFPPEKESKQTYRRKTSALVCDVCVHAAELGSLSDECLWCFGCLSTVAAAAVGWFVPTARCFFAGCGLIFSGFPTLNFLCALVDLCQVYTQHAE